MAKVLVVGGAGYIGSYMNINLKDHGHDVVVLDDLSYGHEESLLGATFVKGDLGDAELLGKLFTENNFDAVMHFAAFIQVGESVENPSKYYQNNTAKTLVLLDQMVKHNVKRFIFSSTAAVFGEPEYVPIDEAHPKAPINPYGRSKYMVEQILEDYDKAYGLKSICLRYFNACGADPECRVGECHEPESHLIPLILQAASGRRDAITVFGRDYDTPDGTCVRDYVHIHDLCAAHTLALEKLLDGAGSNRYNLGNGEGFSVQQVIDTVKQVTGKDFTVSEGAKRDGDPAKLIADSARAKAELNWMPEYAGLAKIVEHAWAWELKHFGA